MPRAQHRALELALAHLLDGRLRRGLAHHELHERVAEAALAGVVSLVFKTLCQMGFTMSMASTPQEAYYERPENADAAHKARHLSRFGIQDVEPVVDWAKVRGHVKTAIDRIACHDSQERFENMGVHVIRESGAFLDPNTLQAGDFRVKAKKFVLATGSQPRIPLIPGLDKTPFFTNQTIFENDKPIKHLMVIGGGPIGLEMAQAFKRLGADVTVLEASRILGKEDTELTALVREKILAEGVKIIEGATVETVSGVAEEI